MAVASWLLLAACTSSSSGAAPTGTARPRQTTGTGSTSPTQTVEEPPAYTEPLVLAVDVHSGEIDVSARMARRIVGGQVADWSALGQAPGALTVKRGPRALAAAERSPDVIAVVPASSVGPTVRALSVDGIDPLRHPVRYPLRTPTTTPPPVVSVVTVVGDIMLGRGVGAASAGDPGAALRPLQQRLAAADLTVGNLESTLSDDGYPRQGDDSFAADPAVLGPLDRAGFDVLSLANNHSGDYGDHALRQTLRRIGASPIRSVGAGRNARAAWRPVVLRRHGVSFGFVAFNAIGETPRATADSPGAAEIRMPPRTGPLNLDDLHRMIDVVSELAEQVDVVLVLPHWGEQYTNAPVPAQRRVGAALVDAGADIVIGGHPHWVQGVQRRSGALIAQSLGNFIFDMDSPETQEGVMLDLVYWGDQLRGVDFTPYVIGSDYAPRPVAGPRAETILDRMWETSDPPFRR